MKVAVGLLAFVLHLATSWGLSVAAPILALPSNNQEKQSSRKAVVRPSQTDKVTSEEAPEFGGHFSCKGFSNGERALCIAVSDVDLREVSRLLGVGANLEVRSNQPLDRGMTMLHLAAWHQWDLDTARLLLDAGAELNTQDRRGNSPLIYAAKSRPAIQSPLIKLLLDSGADVDFHGEKGMTALMHASMHDNPAVITMLLRAGAEVQCKDKAGWTALMHATRRKYGHARIVALLIGAGSSVNATHRRGGTALSSAAYNGHAQVVELLLAAGAKVNAADDVGWTPLICSSVNGHVEVVKQLIEAGVGVNARDRFGRTALSAASTHGQTDVANLLRAAGAR